MLDSPDVLCSKIAAIDGGASLHSTDAAAAADCKLVLPLQCEVQLILLFCADLPRGWEEGFSDDGASYFIK